MSPEARPTSPPPSTCHGAQLLAQNYSLLKQSPSVSSNSQSPGCPHPVLTCVLEQVTGAALGPRTARKGSPEALDPPQGSGSGLKHVQLPYRAGQMASLTPSCGCSSGTKGRRREGSPSPRPVAPQEGETSEHLLSESQESQSALMSCQENTKPTSRQKRQERVLPLSLSLWGKSRWWPRQPVSSKGDASPLLDEDHQLTSQPEKVWEVEIVLGWESERLGFESGFDGG